jgi:hypothetical protein
VSSELANHEDIKHLIEQEYSISFIGAHLVVNDVYYLDADGTLQKGSLAAPLNQPTPQTVGRPNNHQMYWAGSAPGSAPYYTDGTRIPLGRADANALIGGLLFKDILSNKVQEEGWPPTYSVLVEHYVALISAPAEQKFGVSARTGASYDVPPDTSPFKVRDTMSARAEITDLNELLAKDRVAIIGLGGTGAFVLDFLVKTPVAAITAYDFDTFKVHNAFRTPGEIPMGQFGQPKIQIYRNKYEPFRHRLDFQSKQVGHGDEQLFRDTTFAFICIDDGEARSEICTMLTGLGVPFIDVGIGVEKEGGALDGLIRTTLFTAETTAMALEKVPTDARRDDVGYRVFVQVAELNALNAALAVIRYKQLRGFYADDYKYYNLLASIGSSNCFGDA